MAFQPKLLSKYHWLKKLRNALRWLFLFYLRFFAKLALLSFSGKSIGIAGAVGKSTTRNALQAILEKHKPTLVVSGNSETGIPLGILNLSPGSYRLRDIVRVIISSPWRIFVLKPYQFLIVEMGIDGPQPPKNMGYLLTIIKPHIGILVNESPAHVANYEASLASKTNSLEDIVRFMTHDDGQMLQNSNITTAIINGDDQMITTFSETLPKHLVRTVGLSPKHDCTLSHHQISLEGTTFEFSIHTFQEHTNTTLFFPALALPKETGIALGMAMVAVMSLGVPFSVITENLQSNFILPAGRGSILSGINEATILDSSYNASSASVLSFLELMRTITIGSKTPKFFVMGDMKELGSFSQYEHTQVAMQIPESVDHVVLVGTLTKDLVLPILTKHKNKLKTLVHFNTSRQAGEYLKTHLPTKAIVLFKGSQLLEEAIKFILKNPVDAKFLCRQDEFWKNAKKKNGTWVEIN